MLKAILLERLFLVEINDSVQIRATVLAFLLPFAPLLFLLLMAQLQKKLSTELMLLYQSVFLFLYGQQL